MKSVREQQEQELAPVDRAVRDVLRLCVGNVITLPLVIALGPPVFGAQAEARESLEVAQTGLVTIFQRMEEYGLGRVAGEGEG
eukprot:7186453-Prorocentrum_lima.AAC.1